MKTHILKGTSNGGERHVCNGDAVRCPRVYFALVRHVRQSYDPERAKVQIYMCHTPASTYRLAFSRVVFETGMLSDVQVPILLL